MWLWCGRKRIAEPLPQACDDLAGNPLLAPTGELTPPPPRLPPPEELLPETAQISDPHRPKSLPPPPGGSSSPPSVRVLAYRFEEMSLSAAPAHARPPASGAPAPLNDEAIDQETERGRQLWRRQTLSHAWSSWREPARSRSLLSRAMRRWADRMSARAWSQWRWRVHEIHLLRRCTSTTRQRWSNHTLARAWRSWQSCWQDRATAQRLLSQAARRWHSARLSHGWQSWQSWWTIYARVRETSQRGLKLWHGYAWSRSWRSWCEYAAWRHQQLHMYALCARAQRHWLNWQLALGWSQWRQMTSQRELLCYLRAVVSQL